MSAAETSERRRSFVRPFDFDIFAISQRLSVNAKSQRGSGRAARFL